MTEADILALTYNDACSVYRRGNRDDPDTGQTQQYEQLIGERIPCALSQDKGRGFSSAAGYGKVSGDYVLFCRPCTPIRAGDKIVMRTAAGQELALWAGQPFAYAGSHMEVPLSLEVRT